MTTVSSGSTLSRSATTSRPRFRNEVTTCGLWISDPSDFTREPESMVSFAILMARFTPKQKPALSATITSMSCLLFRAQCRDHVHDLPGESAHFFAFGMARLRRHHRRAERDPDRHLPQHRAADLIRTRDARGGDRSPSGRGETPHPCPGRHQLAALVPRPFRKDEDGTARGQHFLGPAEPGASLGSPLNRDGIIGPDEGSEQGIMEQFRLRDEVHLPGEVGAHQRRVPEGDVVARDDQGAFPGNPFQALDVEVEECAREKARETAAERVNGTDPLHRLPGELGPPGGEGHRLLGADAGRVEEDRVGGPDERARLALRVPPVPLADQRDDRLPVRALPPCPNFQIAPLGARLSARRYEDLEIGVWEDNGADIASFHDEPRRAREGALDRNELPA